jgi:hypothetical protein
MKPLARKNQLIVEDFIDECIVYDRNHKKAHSLNSTLTWIWHHSDGSTDVEEMALQFEKEFGCADSLDVVLSGIQLLETANLLVLTPRIERIRYNRVHRRLPREFFLAILFSLNFAPALITVRNSVNTHNSNDDCDQTNYSHSPGQSSALPLFETALVLTLLAHASSPLVSLCCPYRSEPFQCPQ